MSKFVLEIETDNAAFGETSESRAAEIAALLDDLSQRLYLTLSCRDMAIQDSNGNTVGWVKFLP